MNYPDVMSEAATLRAAEGGRSLARFGDGELKLILGRDAKSQRCERDLSAILRRILLATDGPCLPCIPNLRPKGPKTPFWTEYARQPYVGLYKSAGSYGSSFVTRPDSAPSIDTPGYWSQLRSLWAGRDVVLVRGSTKSFTAQRLPEATSVEEIVGPVQHAWSQRRQLMERLRGERRRVILCLGATATVLAWELAEVGVHALDLGHAGMFARRVGPDGRIGNENLGGKD